MKNEKYYFRENEIFCYDKVSHLKYMKENGLKSMTVYEIVLAHNNKYVYCRMFNDILDKSNCNIHNCCSYTPRNKKGGICSHHKLTTGIGQKKVLKLIQ